MSEENQKKKTGRKKTGRKGIKKSFYLSPLLLELLQKEADQEHRSASSMLAIILRSRYEEQIEKSEESGKEDKDAKS